MVNSCLPPFVMYFQILIFSHEVVVSVQFGCTNEFYDFKYSVRKSSDILIYT